MNSETGMEKAALRATRHGLLFVSAATLLFSTSPVLARWAGLTLGPYETSFWRLAIAGFAVLTVATVRRERLPAPGDWPRFALFGLITSLHFVFYIASLDYTTVAHSLAIVYTAPVFVALLSRLIYREQLSPRRWLGIGVVVAGVMLLAGFSTDLDRRMLLGDLLAVGSAITFALYSLAGRSQVKRYALFAYAGSVYLVGAIWTLPLALITWSPEGYTAAAIWSLLGLALLPLGVGHTLYNAALRRTSTTVVNVVATQELTLGVLWGVLLLSEMPSLSSATGALVMLIGTILVIL